MKCTHISSNHGTSGSLRGWFFETYHIVAYIRRFESATLYDKSLYIRDETVIDDTLWVLHACNLYINIHIF